MTVTVTPEDYVTIDVDGKKYGNMLLELHKCGILFFVNPLGQYIVLQEKVHMTIDDAYEDHYTLIVNQFVNT